MSAASESQFRLFFVCYPIFCSFSHSFEKCCDWTRQFNQRLSFFIGRVFPDTATALWPSHQGWLVCWQYAVYLLGRDSLLSFTPFANTVASTRAPLARNYDAIIEGFAIWKFERQIGGYLRACKIITRRQTIHICIIKLNEWCV